MKGILVRIIIMKNAYLINEITAEIVNEDDHYNPYGSGF